ncbi:MAG: hypothetical protein ACHQUC_01735 [Chlamydiales bacterium]
MQFKILITTCLLLVFSFSGYALFIEKRENLQPYYNNSTVVMIASSGRSGSTMLTQQMRKYISSDKVLKTHLLPPEARFQGKILFIYSDPNRATESALYMMLHHENFGPAHFRNLETADRKWFRRIGGSRGQTIDDNLLSYDAFGVYEHLKGWLYTRTEPTDPENAQILAIKYENLWDDATVSAIRSFLKIDNFQLPLQKPRGHDKEKLYSKEIRFRKMYNLGTEKNPRYAAYDDATILWEQAPPFQYLKILQ